MADPLVAIFLGSKSDLQVAEKAAEVFDRFEIPYSLNVASAHRTPKYLEELVRNSPAKVLIGMSAGAAALSGVLAALTMRPVIGVPVGGKVPFDSLLSVVQMPPGMPVATVGVDRGENAALLATAMLAMNDERIQSRLAQYREEQRAQLLEVDEALQRERKR
jgi:5-(carboxyamino)imidazole ribonucleotide mutase